MSSLKPVLWIAAFATATVLASPVFAQQSPDTAPPAGPSGQDTRAVPDNRGGPRWREQDYQGGDQRGRYSDERQRRERPPSEQRGADERDDRRGGEEPRYGRPDGGMMGDRRMMRERGSMMGERGMMRERGRMMDERGMMPGRGGMMGGGMMSPMFAMMRLCGQRSGRFGARMLEHLEGVTQPTPAQRLAFDKLKEAATQAGETIRAACPTERPITPPGRLAAAEKRLTAWLEAIRTVRPAMDAFYGSLSDEQKARLYIAQPRMHRGGAMGQRWRERGGDGAGQRDGDRDDAGQRGRGDRTDLAPDSDDDDENDML